MRSPEVFVVRFTVALVTFATLLVPVGACSDDGFTAAVELRTDLTPGVEFDAARTTFEGRTIDHYAAGDEDYVDGVRIADLDGLSPGNHSITVTLLSREGTVVERNVQVALSGNSAVSVVVARSCREVTCPATSGDPAHDTCVAGQCVDPRCVDDGPYCPVAECATDAECSVAATCGRATCEDGTCFAIGDDAACDDGQYCDPDVGCRPIGGGIPDAGAMDSSTPDSGAVDGGPADTAPPDAGPSCATERLLATSTYRTTNGDSRASPEWDLVLSQPNGFPELGDGRPITHGFSGVTEFRHADDPEFRTVVDAFSSGAASNAYLGIKPTGRSTLGWQPTSFSAPLTGTVITLVRRNVLSFSAIPILGAGTDLDLDAEWEYWGCDP